jgi:hypothetical protein
MFKPILFVILVFVLALYLAIYQQPLLLDIYNLITIEIPEFFKNLFGSSKS